MPFGLAMAIGLIALIATYIVWSGWTFQRWLDHPAAPGKRVRVGDVEWYIRVQGTGGPVVVIETGLSALSAEWWTIQDELAQTCTVITYDRAGYGWSDASPHPRTSGQIAAELRGLLDALGVPGPYVLVGHSQGGLYVQHFARAYPDQVAGVVLLDPLSAEDNRWKAELPPEVYAGSGVDKSPTLKTGVIAARLGLLRLLERFIKQSPPFYYMRNPAPEVVNAIWQHMQRASLYTTALEEYRLAHDPANTAALYAAGDFPAVPLKVLYHDAKVIIAETMQYGGLSEAQAAQVESFWEALLREMLTLSPHSEWISCEGASHFIHLTRPDIVVAQVKALLEAKTR